jgi:hypothetical protein
LPSGEISIWRKCCWRDPTYWYTSQPGRRFQHDLLKVLIAEVQRSHSQQQVQVTLYIRLGTAGPAVREASDERLKVDRTREHDEDARRYPASTGSTVGILFLLPIRGRVKR